MTKELCASIITTATSGKLILREYSEGGTKDTAFNSRKELADYINPQTTAPAAPPYPSNQANLQNMVSGINCANTPFMNAVAGKQFNCTPSDAPNVIHGEIGAALANHFAPKEAKKPEQFINDNLKKLAEFAVSCGYGGRLGEFPRDLEIIKRLGDDLQKLQANLQDDSDIEQIARERKGGATVKVSLDDLQDDGK